VKGERVEAFVARALALGEQDEANEIGYTARAMIQATMPHSETKELSFTRTNGSYTLSMMGNPKVGLPFGPIPRLILYWLTSEAVKTGESTLFLGDSLSGFMRELGMAVTGGKDGSINRFKRQVERLLTTGISCLYRGKGRGTGVNFFIADSFDLWWTPKTPEQISIWESEIKLSQGFYEEITKAPVPVRMETLRLLKSSSLSLDIYAWATYRNSYARKESAIPYKALQNQFGAGYPLTTRGRLDFKKKFLEALKKVSLAYPEVSKLRDEGNVLVFVPGQPDVPPTKMIK
jgi:hypothetical protein